MQVEAQLMAGEYERNLAQAVLAGNGEAIKELEKILRPAIYNLARLHQGNGRPAHEHRDGVDHVLIYLMTGLRHQQGGLSTPTYSPLYKWLSNPQKSLVGYCLVSARNYLVDLSRLRGIKTEPLNTEEGTHVDASDHFTEQLLQELFDKERKRAVQDIYEKLPLHDRRILTMKFHDDKTDAEIGDLLGISETSARNRRTRAQVKFKELFLRKYPQFAHWL